MVHHRRLSTLVVRKSVHDNIAISSQAFILVGTSPFTARRSLSFVSSNRLGPVGNLLFAFNLIELTQKFKFFFHDLSFFLQFLRLLETPTND